MGSKVFLNLPDEMWVIFLLLCLQWRWKTMPVHIQLCSELTEHNTFLQDAESMHGAIQGEGGFGSNREAEPNEL